jgi:MFS family permease
LASLNFSNSLSSCALFVICFFIRILFLTKFCISGLGFGMIYLPSIVSVGYYFEKKRAMATGIAVCGSGIGTFIFSPLSKSQIIDTKWNNNVYIKVSAHYNFYQERSKSTENM